METRFCERPRCGSNSGSSSLLCWKELHSARVENDAPSVSVPWKDVVTGTAMGFGSAGRVVAACRGTCPCQQVCQLFLDFPSRMSRTLRELHSFTCVSERQLRSTAPRTNAGAAETFVRVGSSSRVRSQCWRTGSDLLRSVHLSQGLCTCIVYTRAVNVWQGLLRFCGWG